MNDEIKNDEVIEDLAVTPIADEDLEDVAGGARSATDCTGCVETGCCTTGASVE